MSAIACMPLSPSQNIRAAYQSGQYHIDCWSSQTQRVHASGTAWTYPIATLMFKTQLSLPQDVFDELEELLAWEMLEETS